MTLPTIQSYGEYASSNYGAHSLRVMFPSGFTLYYSYETIVAFIGNSGRRVRQNDWSTVTGKHLNWIDGGSAEACKSRIKGQDFEVELKKELAAHNLL